VEFTIIKRIKTKYVLHMINLIKRNDVIDIQKIRADFPILQRKVHGKPLIYLDSTATTQKPNQVLEAINNYFLQHNSNVHRGVHKLSEEATEIYELAHQRVAEFISAQSMEEIIFVRNTTEAINLARYAWAFHNLKPGDEIVTTILEHHSNIVPWLSLKERGVKIKFVDIDEDGNLKLDHLMSMITRNTKLVAVGHVSNVLGTINPVKEITEIAHDAGALCLVDAAQSVPHMPVDVQYIDCDFLAFSGHKMLAPSIGVLYVKKEVLKKMQPFLYGGDMIKEVHTDRATWNDIPWKFEAGTPDVASAAGITSAIDYLDKIGMQKIREHEKEITAYSLEKLQEINDIIIYGTRDANMRGGIVSFNLGDIHPHDLASVLDEDGIAIRSGHHCAMPLMERLGLQATARASFYIYNTLQEVDKLAESLQHARKIFKLE